MRPFALVLALLASAPANAQPVYLYVTIDPPNAARSGAWAINNLGQVVGRYRLNGNLVGYVVDGASYRTVNPFGDRDAWVYGINDAGDIVGSDGSSECFLLRGGVRTALRRPAAAINNHGQLV